LCSWLLVAGACTELVEGASAGAGDDDDEGTTGPSEVTLDPITASASGSPTSTTDAETTDVDPTVDPPETSDDTTATAPGDTTADPSEGTADESSSTGPAVDPGFLDCLNDGEEAACTRAETCISDSGSTLGVCAVLGCADVSECPAAPPGGDALPACSDGAMPQGNECILDCSGGAACPTGMFCFDQILCVWAREGLPVEDFADGVIPPAWTLHDVDGKTPADEVSFVDEAWVIADHAGDLVAVSTSWYVVPGRADDWLVSPAVAIGAASTLTFEARAMSSEFPDGYEVRISTTGTDVADFTANPPLLTVAAEEDMFTPHTIDLAAEGYADQTVWIAWRNTSDDQYLLVVDDIEITY
jgi:hypothetical protein